MAISSVIHQANGMLAHGINFYATANTIVKNVNKVAIPAIVFFALANVAGAEAGPMAYAACTTLCLGFATPIFAPVCITACLPALAAPTP